MRGLVLFLLLCALGGATYNETLAKLLGRLTVSSYCVARQINSWSCLPCKKVPDMKFVQVFKNRTNDTCGYIGINDAQDATILVFRGTLPWDLKNWISDINFIKKKYPYCDNGCQVHRGFMSDYEQMSANVLKLVRNYTQTFKKSKLYVTGHSLGGALSTLGVADLMSNGIRVDEYYNMGSPRVGDKNFQEWFDRLWGNRFKARITHHRDPVPHSPQLTWGFHHTNTEVFYNQPNSHYDVCDDTGEDKKCSNKFLFDTNLIDHGTYLGLDYVLGIADCQ